MSAVRTTPPGAPAAALYAVVKSPWAVMATASPACVVPITVAGGVSPVIALPGHTPTSPVIEVAVPATLVTVEPARIPKLQAVPRLIGAAEAHDVADVVNVHTKLLASALPNRSLAPVVIVAVYTVLSRRLLPGVKV